jgi:hypothetical protein
MMDASELDAAPHLVVRAEDWIGGALHALSDGASEADRAAADSCDELASRERLHTEPGTPSLCTPSRAPASPTATSPELRKPETGDAPARKDRTHDDTTPEADREDGAE